MLWKAVLGFIKPTVPDGSPEERIGMDLKSLKMNLYLFACGLYITTAIVFSSLWGTDSSLHTVFVLARCVSYFIILGKLGHDFVTRQIPLKHIVIMGSVGLFLLISAYITKNKNPLIYWIFIIAGHDVDYRSILKAALAGHIAGLVLVMGSSIAGLIDNLEYIRTEGAVRESLGFSYATAAANYFFYTVLLWGAIRREDISFTELGLLFAATVLLFIKTDTKSAFLLSVVFIIILLVFKLFKPLRRFYGWYKIPAILLVPVCAVFIISICASYDPEISWMSRLNAIITNRLMWGRAGFEKFGVHPMGSFIQWVGMDGDYSRYNYVDSSFVQILLNFGPLFLLVLIAGLEAYVLRVCWNRDIYMLLVFIFFVVHSVFDPQLILIAYNSFLLAYGYVKDRDQQAASHNPVRAEHG